ncbi:ATP-grasp domain-containing protein [Gelidibacter sp. F2691]|uniref:ATP-grasp domain-containing protein n=1 Tax=uncultured Gelidibacter sp. TaxID=259318 RepID=UPI001FF590E2|nr:ATP-grasp domain-containing protein [uncultured Gelidibacter sp.]MCK0125139.1 ATP-grasp domain-containing protein [Gelidibacter sp. F2691]
MGISVLIPDGESHLLIYVINSLSQIKEIKIFIMSNVKYIPMRYSRHIYHFSYYRKTEHEQAWISNINYEIETHKIDIVMPIFEDGIETIIKFRKYLDSNKLCLLPTYINFETAKNKWLLTKHLLVNDIPFPKSMLYSPNASFNLDNFRFPIILKPILETGGGDGVCFFENKEALQRHLLSEKIGKEQLIQEYVKGYDIGCSVLCKNGDILAFTIQRATMLNSNPFKPLLGVKFVYEEDLYKIVERLMKSLDWSGVAHIDLKYDIENKTFKVIEVNTRFWGSLDASLMAGVNFPHLYCLTSLNACFEHPKYDSINYLNLKGLAKSIIKNKSLLFDGNFILKNTPVSFALKDPLPTIFKYTLFIKNIVLTKIKMVYKDF